MPRHVHRDALEAADVRLAATISVRAPHVYGDAASDAPPPLDDDALPVFVQPERGQGAQEGPSLGLLI